MTQLLIPIWGHKNEILSKFGRNFHDHIMVTEATSSALGFTAGVGFIILLTVIFIGNSLRVDNRIKILAKLNLAAVLFATVGGLGVVFALLVTPQFRGLNRVSIFIGFFSLLAVLILIEAVLNRWNNSGDVRKYLSSTLAICLMLFVQYDQVPAGARGNNPSLEKEFKEEKEFISIIEKSLKPNCSIYQLPYLKFPEVAPLNKEGYQVMLRPYLQSEHLSWSYGGIKGRMGDSWNEELNKLSIQDKLAALKQSKFCGIYVERLAFKDNGEEVETELKKLLPDEPVESLSGKTAFYRFDPISGGAIKPSTALNLGKGFYIWEVNNAGQRWAWGKQKAELKIFNFKENDQVVLLEAEVSSPNSTKAYINSNDNGIEELQLNKDQSVELRKKITLKPGINILKFETDLSAVKVGQDPRALAIRLMNPVLKPLRD
jgi:phosphoglycerol transferase